MLALAGPALAQDQRSSVSIYGFLKVDVENVRGTGGANAFHVSRLSNDLSVLGFRAIEDLGGGLSAFAQFEGNVKVDTGDAPFGGRNSAVGLRGSFGQVLLGQWESPLRFVSVYAVDPFTAGIFAFNSIMGNGFVTGGNGDVPSSFDRRQANLIQYFAPKVNGFGGRVAYAPSEEKTVQKTPDFVSGLLTYENDGLYLAYGFERHRKYFAPGTSDLGQRIGAAYSFGKTRVSMALERLHYEPTASSHINRNAWQLAVTRTIGNGVLRASYVRALGTTGNATAASASLVRMGAPNTDSGAKQLSLGYGHKLSKRTELWGAYTRLMNGRTATYNLSANGVPGLQAGQTLSGIGLGITHSF